MAPKRSNINEIITKEMLEKDYLIDNLTVQEIANKYGFKTGVVYKEIKKYNFKKSKEQVQQAREKTNIEKYGCTNPFGNEEIIAKLKQTNIEKYGVENPSQSEEVQNKIKQTNLERYGCENAVQNQDIQNKIKATNLEKYGVENPMQSQEIQNKIKQSNLEKYGVTSHFQREEVKEKIKQTNLEKYGVDHYYKLPEVAAQVNKRLITAKKEKLNKMSPDDKYLYYLNILEKTKQTNLEKYGVEYISQSDIIKDRIKNNNLKKYNLEYPNQNEYIFKYFKNKEDAKSFIEENYKFKTTLEIAENLNMSAGRFREYIKKFKLEELIDYKYLESSYEREIKDILKAWGINNIISRDRYILNYKEIDIYLPDYKIGIEFNGSYWHSDEFKSPLYHQKKSLLAESKGIFLYHIFEYEWVDPDMKQKIINQLKNILHKNETKVYARKCEIREVSSHDKREFISQHHVQSDTKSKVNLGLYYNDELVSIMTFGEPRFTDKYQWEIVRFCSKSGLNVIGSASKLFKHFVNNYLNDNEIIISYSHISKTRGQIYKALGFELKDISRPGYVWWLKDADYKTRYQTMMKNESQIMTEQGYTKIYDCGNKVWIYKKGNENGK